MYIYIFMYTSIYMYIYIHMYIYIKGLHDFFQKAQAQIRA